MHTELIINMLVEKEMWDCQCASPTSSLYTISVPSWMETTMN
jgi:hypothetical protein